MAWTGASGNTVPMRSRTLLTISALLLIGLNGCSSSAPQTSGATVARVVTVPDESGKPISDAQDFFTASGLGYEFLTRTGAIDHNSYDTVATQTPPAGTKVKHGTIIHIVTALGPSVAIPALTGQFQLDASIALQDAHLGEADIPSTPEATMKVVKQVPAAGSKASEGSIVTLTFKNPLERVPKFVGLHTDQLATKFESTSFVEVDHPSEPDDTWHVIKQVPAPGGTAHAGSRVAIWWGPPRVVYTVTGNGTFASSITYSTGGTNQRQAVNARLPWSFSMPENDSDFAYYAVLAQDGSGTSITCTITDDGHLVTRQTSTGSYAIADCSGQ
jgi:beta-lactam-binding protein with PASTA domain